jgi:phage tail sheath protein FI
VLSRNGTALERWFNLSSDPASLDYFVSVLNDADSGSDLVQAEDLVGDDDPYTVGLPPAVGTQGPFTLGDDGLVGLADADYVGAKASSLLATGIHVFALGEERGDILIVPGRGTSATHNGMITFCVTTRRERLFAILDPPQSQTAEQMVTYVSQTANLYLSTRCAAIYYPEVKIANPSTEVYGAATTITAPPSGLVAGICARVSAAKVGGAFDHPAGPAAPYLPRGVLGFATSSGEAPSKDDRDLMYPYNINFVSREERLPIFVDGSRTLDMEGAFGSVGESRGVIFFQKALEPALARCRHRGISQKTLDDERDTTTQFCVELTRGGAFASSDPEEAFVVDFGKFGEGLNVPSVSRARKTVGAVALATAKPNEFIIVSLSEDRRALDAELAAAG